MNIDEKLDHFYSSVIDSATKQNIEIVENYKVTLEQTFKERKESAIRKSESAYRIASDNVAREKNRKLSVESIDIKRRILEKTAEIEQHVFSDVEKKVLDFIQTAEYDNFLCTQIKNAHDFAGGDQITIYINLSDAGKKSSLEEKTGAVLTISDRDFIGGIRAVIPSHSILIDNSFKTRLEEAKSSFTLQK